MTHMKLIVALTAATALSGCLALPGSDYGNAPQSYGQSASYGADCATPCASGYDVGSGYVDHGYTSAPAPHGPAYGQSHGQPYGQPHHAQHQALVYPGAHAYGGAPQHSYTTPYAARQGLRGGQSASPYLYGSLGGTMYDTDADFYGIQGRLGYQSKSIFGAEIEGSIGLTDETSLIGLDTFDVKVDNQIAAFAVARLPVGEKFNVLGRVGYHNTEFSGELTTPAGVSTSADVGQDGIAYGIGAEYKVSPLTSLRGDLTRYDVDGGSLDSVSLAVARKF